MKFSIENKIAECKNRIRNIDVEIAVLRKEREVVDQHKTDFEILLDDYYEEHKEESK